MPPRQQPPGSAPSARNACMHKGNSKPQHADHRAIWSLRRVSYCRRLACKGNKMTDIRTKAKVTPYAHKRAIVSPQCTKHCATTYLHTGDTTLRVIELRSSLRVWFHVPVLEWVNWSINLKG
eukprot:5911534-Amphidinium_carterae.1